MLQNRAAERTPKPVLIKKIIEQLWPFLDFFGKFTPKLPRNVGKKMIRIEIKFRDDAQRTPDLSRRHIHVCTQEWVKKCSICV